MPSEDALEVISAAELQADVTRLIMKRLGGRLAVEPVTAPTRGGGRFREVEINVSGQDFVVVELKVLAKEVLEAVNAAIADMLDSHTQLLRLTTRNPELAPVISAVVEQVPRAVQVRRQALIERHIDALVDVYLANDPLASALPDLERDNAEAQANFLKRNRVLTAEDIAKRAGHGSRNLSATASRWKRKGKIFAVKTGGREVYPAFQFKEGQPRAAIAEVLAALPKDHSGWQIAFWFTGANGWLDGAAPVDRLDDSVALLSAAGHEADVWMG